MNIFELFILAIGLSMDAFAVSVCKGLSLGKINAGFLRGGCRLRAGYPWQSF